MPYTTFCHRSARSGLATVLWLGWAATAFGADTYGGGVLSMPSLAIGSATYSNVVVNVGRIISGPTGSAADGIVDSYNPGTNQLTVQSVNVGGATYHNVVVTVAGLVSIGGVTGADTYNGANLDISYVQLYGTIYKDVVVSETLSDVIGVAGGMPTDVPDTYSLVLNELAIPAVQVGNHVYTNVIVTVGNLVSVGGEVTSEAETSLYSFTGGLDGGSPGPLTFSGGTYYGTSTYGGKYSYGTVFSVTPDGIETVLHAFTGSNGTKSSVDGANPYGGVTLGIDGNLYGTTFSGGQYGVGSVYKITPTGAETTLYSFTGDGGVTGSTDGGYPVAGLVQGKDGNFYGTTEGGGANQQGTVFKVTPAGAETLVYAFGASRTDAAGPQAALILGSDGNLYGTTLGGGEHGQGTVFRVTPAGAETVLYSFTGSTGNNGPPDGEQPTAALVQGPDGNFYGTTNAGGANQYGTAFKLTPAGTETWVYSFSGDNGLFNGTNAVDGAQPQIGLTQGNDGNFYGTTIQGGAYSKGTVFKITPTGIESMLYSFSGCVPNGGCGISGSTDGALPQSVLVQAIDGSLFGTASAGGANGVGTVFNLKNVELAQ